MEGYRAEKFIEYTDGAEPLTEMDTDFMLKTLDHIKVFEDGTLLVVFLDGTEIECKMKRSKKRCRLGVAIPDRLFSCSFSNSKNEMSVVQ